jgi:DNA polymerase III alpha subunit
MYNVKLLVFLIIFSFIPIKLTLAGEAQAVPEPAEFMEVTIDQLVSDPGEYNNERVTLEGFVDKVKYTKSSKGEPFTLFRLNDGTKNEVRVYYEDEHLALSKGDKVRIQGRFKKQKKYFLYNIKNVIKARAVKKLETI